MKVAFLSALVLFVVTNTYASNDCQSEITITVDLSETISNADLKLIKDFVKNVGSLLGAKNKIAVATFAEEAKKVVSCSEHNIFKKKVEAIERFGKFTNIEAGLALAEELLDKEGCSLHRPGRHVILLISDGNANRGKSLESLYHNSDRIRDRGIQIFSLGIKNDHFKKHILERISDNVKEISGFAELNKIDIEHIISKISCVPKPKTTTTKPPDVTTGDYFTSDTTSYTTEYTTEYISTYEPTDDITTEYIHTYEPTDDIETTTKKPHTTTTTTKKPHTTTTTTKKPHTTTTTTKKTTLKPHTTKPTENPPDGCSCEIHKDQFPCLSWVGTSFLHEFEGNTIIEQYQNALNSMHTQTMQMLGKVLAIRKCQKFRQDSIISASVSQFKHGLPSSPIIDKSRTLQDLFLKQNQCECNIKTLMSWKIKMVSLKGMVEHMVLMLKEPTDSSHSLSQKILKDLTGAH